MICNVVALLAFQLMNQRAANAFTILPSMPKTYQATRSVASPLHAKKQSRSTLLKPERDTKSKDEEKEEDGGEVYGAKFFGGNAIKEELFDEKLEEQADKLQKLYPEATEEGEDELSYNRFMDTEAFDVTCRSLAQRLQSAINQALYEEDDFSSRTTNNNIYSANLQWNTPLSRAKDSKNPLNELTKSLDFYKRVDCAIISAKNLSGDESASVKKTEVGWELSVIWPNFFESRVLISGTSILTVDVASETILSQTDSLDMGGKDGKDIIKAISPQIQPRFWDLYHIGMTPSSETMTRAESSKVSKGAFSSYSLFEIPPRLVLQPSMEDEGGRDARNAEALPNHAFSTVIKTTGPLQQRYVPSSPVEVSIRREPGVEDGEMKSIISWNVGLPPEFVSYYDELPMGNDEDDEGTCEYSYQSRRLVATLPYGGGAQDPDVSNLRKKLYEQVMKDGLKPKLLNGRPQFFFLNNDVKACFTADGGLGMAVYEWRPAFSKANEVGIELEL